MTVMNMVDALNSALRLEMERDSNVVVLGEDVGVDGGVFRVTDGLIKKFGEKRVIDTPLAESGIVGFSIGMAMMGLRPVAEIQFDGFVYPAFDQLISHASRMRTRTRGRYSCPMVVRMPYSGGIRALEHHSESMEAIFVHTPGLKVVIPSTPYDAKGLLTAAIQDDDPVIFYEPKRIYRAIKQEVPDEPYSIPLGKASVVKEGSDVSVFCYGAMVREVLKAAEMVPQINCEVIDLRSLKPMDSEAIVASVKKTGRAVVVHEAPMTAGVGAEIMARIHEKAFLSLEAPVARVTGFDTIFPLYRLEQYYLPSAERIRKAIEDTAHY